MSGGDTTMSHEHAAVSDRFDAHRVAVLFRRDAIRVYRAVGIAAAAITALMIVQAMLTQPFATDRETVYIGFISLLCFIGGPIVASRAFAELHDKTRNEAYLLLPASAVEKVLVRGALVTIGYFVGATFLVTVVAYIVLAIKAIAFGAVEQPFVPAQILDIRFFGLFFAHQSLFLLGAAWFRRYHFVKTGLAVAVLVLGLGWFAMIAMRILLPDFGETLSAIGFNPWPLLVRIGESYGAVGWLFSLLGFVALPAFCWWVAWLRVREAQVSHGV